MTQQNREETRRDQQRPDERRPDTRSVPGEVKPTDKRDPKQDRRDDKRK